MEMTEDGYRIILLETTREELDKLQKFTGEDISKWNASKLLGISQRDREHFWNVRERFLFRDPDNRIAQFCMNHKDNVILWTADKRLATEVNGSNCEVVYLGPDGMATAQPNKTKRVAKFWLQSGRRTISIARPMWHLLHTQSSKLLMIRTSRSTTHTSIMMCLNRRLSLAIPSIEHLC